MGKKPVVAMFGLVWAGIALTGCGKCCQNCHNKYDPPPTFSSRANTPAATSGTPTMIGDTRSGGAAVPTNKLTEPAESTGFAATPPSTAMPHSTSGMGPAPIQPVGAESTGMPAMKGPATGMPSSQSSLRPLDEPVPPTSMSGGRPEPGRMEMTSSSTELPRPVIPPPPVTKPVNGTMSAPARESLPPISGQPLPALESNSALPAAPTPPSGSLPSPEAPPSTPSLPPYLNK